MIEQRQRRIVAASIPLMLAAISVTAHAQNLEAEKTQTLKAARQGYYNLKRAGLVEFSANIQPNWDSLLPEVKNRSKGRELLDSLRFSLSVDSQSKLRMDHYAEIVPSDQKLAEFVDRIFKGMDESVSSFFGTWSIFSLTSPFPDVGSDYAISESAGRYIFTQRQSNLDVMVSTDNDFMVTEIRASGPELTASLNPVLEKTANGFLLKGYIARSELLSGARKTTVKASLEYAEVNGLKMLHKVSLDTVFQGEPAKVEWLFSNYQVKVR